MIGFYSTVQNLSLHYYLVSQPSPSPGQCDVDWGVSTFKRANQSGVKFLVGFNNWWTALGFNQGQRLFWIARLRRYRRAFLGIKATLERKENIRDSGDHLPRLESHKRHQNVVIDDDAISYIPPRCLTFLVCSFHHYVREIHVEKSAVVV